MGLSTDTALPWEAVLKVCPLLSRTWLCRDLSRLSEERPAQVHRDLNAKNFMITGDDRTGTEPRVLNGCRTVKLIDFGLATRFYGYLPQDQYIEIVGRDSVASKAGC